MRRIKYQLNGGNYEPRWGPFKLKQQRHDSLAKKILGSDTYILCWHRIVKWHPHVIRFFSRFNSSCVAHKKKKDFFLKGFHCYVCSATSWERWGPALDLGQCKTRDMMWISVESLFGDTIWCKGAFCKTFGNNVARGADGDGFEVKNDPLVLVLQNDGWISPSVARSLKKLHKL